MAIATEADDGFLDLHCHLLPGVDDGAKSLEESLQMAQALVTLGFSQVAVSPHARQQYATQEACEQAFRSLKEALERSQIPLSLQLSAENAFLEDGFLGAVESSRVRTIGGSRAVLVEAPYQAPLPALLDLIFRLRVKGYQPLLAHPERCLEFERKGRAEEAVRAGAWLQLDVGALIGRYGRDPKRRALAFLEQGLYGVAATDLHSPVGAQEWVGKALLELRERAGERTVQLLMNERPKSLLRGEAL